MTEKLSVVLRGKRGVLGGRKLDNHEFDLIRDMPGFRKWVEYDLYFELSGQNISFLLKHFPDLNWSVEFSNILQHFRDIENLKEESVLAKLEEPPEELKTFPFKTAPYKHQMTCLNICKDRKAYGLFMEMGTGKSKILIDNIAWLYLKEKIDIAVIVAPNGVHAQWGNEQIPEHMSSEVPYRSHIYRAGHADKILFEINNRLTLNEEELQIICVNIETLSAASGREFVSKVLRIGRALMAVDESSKIKSMSAQRTKTCIELGTLAHYRRIMSGTPVTKGVQDLYSQFSFLDPMILGFNSYYTFRNRYCIMGGFENKQIISYRNLNELQEKIDTHTFRVLKEDCLDLPKTIHTRRDVPFDPEQKKIYDQLRDEFIVELGESTLTAALAITRLTKLQQILCGHVRIGEELRQIPTNRFKSTIEALDEINGKTIIWARFIPDMENLSNHLEEAKIDFVRYTGSSSQEKIDEFRKRDSCMVFLGNPQSAGMGLNLTVSNFTIWFSASFSYEDYKQANDRNHRIGQTKPVTYIHLYTPNSIDTKLYTNLKNKKNLADTLLDIREVLDDAA